ncbi:MAG: hypothetical protein RPR97_07225 [Colwellia sp.]
MSNADVEIWLQTSLVDAAKISGALAHRSAAQQIEYWANLGHKTESLLTQAEILQVINGTAKIDVSSVNRLEVEVETVFQMLEDDRKKGKLSEKVVSPATTRYQKSESRDGYLDQLHPDGHVAIGRFKNGVFIEV